jgi:DNA-binding MarR family transcriptional regulator
MSRLTRLSRVREPVTFAALRLTEMSSESEVEEFARALARVSRAVKFGAGEAMRTLGVHAGQNFVLEELWREDGLTPGELARRIGVEVPTVTRAAQRMEATGLVRRVPDPRDARLVRVTLTAKGEALRDRLPAVLHSVYTQALERLTPQERTQLVRLLKRLAEHAQAPGP